MIGVVNGGCAFCVHVWGTTAQRSPRFPDAAGGTPWVIFIFSLQVRVQDKSVIRPDEAETRLQAPAALQTAIDQAVGERHWLAARA